MRAEPARPAYIHLVSRIPRFLLAVLALAAPFAVSACDSSLSEPQAAGSAPVGLRMVSHAAPASSYFAPVAPRVESGTLMVTGTNGTLEIQSIQVILAEVEFEKDGVECEDSADTDPGCEDFDFEPRLVDLAVDGSEVFLSSGRLLAGIWEEIEVEFEAFDEDEPRPASLADALVGWPADASTRVVGRFVPLEGEPRDFNVWIDAEFEAELEFEPPLRVDENETGVVIEFSIAAWLLRDDGEVEDLSRYDWDATGRVFELDGDHEVALSIRLVGAGD